MTAEEWEEVKEKFHEALALPTDKLQSFLSRKCSDDSVRMEVERLLTEHESAGDFLSRPWMESNSMRIPQVSPFIRASSTETSEDSVGQVLTGDPDHFKQSRCGPYRLLRVLGHGGMGAVYLGERVDGEVEQLVAIKLLHYGRSGPGFRERFLRERQILAKLSHPGIARLLNAGHTEGNQPYLVMDYIAGVPIDIYAGALDLRGKLTLFLEVCEAVAYAHRNLVIHRDLKPSNILVDSAGHPKLLDFGIAKMLDDSLDQTQSVDRVLTPEFASPEQVQGGAQTTATDICSLGAVLYKLLAGCSPYVLEAKSRQEIIDSICTKMPVAASRLNPALPPDLDFILGKALRKEPTERYSSVDTFADDVQAFLEWRPVRARSGDAWYRMRRFVRRYRVVVTAFTLTIISLSIGLYLANRERQIAQHRFSQVRQLAKQFIDLDDELRELPGSTKVRRRIVFQTVQYLAALGKEAHGDTDLALEIGSTYLQVARVQGIPISANLGESKEAGESLRLADSYVDSALRVTPDDRRALLTSAEIAHDRMILLDTQDREDEAMAEGLRAAAHVELMLKRPSDNNPQEIGRATRIFENLCVVARNANRLNDSIRYCQRAFSISQYSEAARRRQALILGATALSLRLSGDLNGALRAVQASRNLIERGTGSAPSVDRFNLITALLREGLVLGNDEDIGLGRTSEALATYQRGLSLSEDLARKDPDDERSRSRIADFSREVGDILRHTNPRLALTIYDHGLSRIREAKPNQSTQKQQADLLARSSYAARWLGRTEDSKRRIDVATRILKVVGAYPSSNVEPFSEADHLLRASADYYAETGRFERAAELYNEEVTKLLAGKTDQQKDIETAFRLSGTWAALSGVLSKMGCTDAAAQFKYKRAALWRKWIIKLPNNRFVLGQIASATPASTSFQSETIVSRPEPHRSKAAERP